VNMAKKKVKKRTHAQLLRLASTYTEHRMIRLAEKLNVNYTTLYGWLDRNKVPKEYWGKFGRLTKGGVVKADFK